MFREQYSLGGTQLQTRMAKFFLVVYYTGAYKQAKCLTSYPSQKTSSKCRQWNPTTYLLVSNQCPYLTSQKVVDTALVAEPTSGISSQGPDWIGQGQLLVPAYSCLMLLKPLWAFWDFSRVTRYDSTCVTSGLAAEGSVGYITKFQMVLNTYVQAT